MMNTPTLRQALESIIAWTDCDAMPDDPAQRLEYYARRMMLIRNAANIVRLSPYNESESLATHHDTESSATPVC